MTSPVRSAPAESDPGGALSLVEVLARSKPRNKAEASFRRLIAEIERRRASLQAWQAYGRRHHERIETEWLPLQSRLRASHRQMILAIDALLDSPAGKRAPGRQQRARLEQILLGLLHELIDEAPDADLVALFEKYHAVSYAQACESDLDLHRMLIEDLLGVDLGRAHGATNADELMEQARRQRQEDRAQRAQRRQSRAGGSGAARKAEAAQARKEQAAREISQSIREVYRKLVSALHPDREADAGERQRKTQLIQRVNQAYEADDLLTLLGLQLEIEQIDAEHLANVAPGRLAHYNQVLREQLAGLDAEIERHVRPFRELIGDARRSMDPALVDHRFSLDLAHLRDAIGQAEADLAALQDPRQLGALLRRFTQQARDDEVETMELLDFIGLFEPDPPPRSSRKRGR